MADTRAKVLEVSGVILPWILGIAFIFGDFGYIGAGITVAICLWYGAWNWRAVIHWKWAMIVIGFFAAIAVKSGIMWLVGEEPFVSFAKAGSRIISLFGAAAIFAAYEEETAERIFGKALGLFAGAIALVALLMRIGRLPQLFINWNSFGIDCCWFPLYLVIVLSRRGGWVRTLGSLFIGLAGAALFFLDAFKNSGSRTAPFAYLLALFLVFLIRLCSSRLLSIGLVSIVLCGTVIFSLTYSPTIDKLLTHRQQLWNAYASKGLERPLLGWGYADTLRAKALLESKLLGRSMHDEFVVAGSGPHNSFLAMFFENGILAIGLYAALLFARSMKNKAVPNLFDTSMFAFMLFMSSDAMNAGGITFLGFFLGVCILAGGKRLPAREA